MKASHEARLMQNKRHMVIKFPFPVKQLNANTIVVETMRGDVLDEGFYEAVKANTPPGTMVKMVEACLTIYVKESITVDVKAEM